MKFVQFINLIIQFISTLPPLFVVTVTACIVILIALAVKRAVFH